MSNDNEEDIAPLQEALSGVSQTPQKIVDELRLMVLGAGQYDALKDVSPWIKNIWSAAADIIEGKNPPKAH